jgi:hypothetical protein
MPYVLASSPYPADQMAVPTSCETAEAAKRATTAAAMTRSLVRGTYMVRERKRLLLLLLLMGRRRWLWLRMDVRGGHEHMWIER